MNKATLEPPQENQEQDQKQDRDSDVIFQLIEQECNLAPIQDLLRFYKKEHGSTSEIKITEQNKHEVIYKNLRAAVSSGTIPQDSLDAMLREAEENGNQHVFYFVPKDPDVISVLSDVVNIGKKLLGQDWTGQGYWTKYLLLPDDPTFTDFRYHLTGIRTGFWTLKLYGSEEFEKVVKIEHIEGPTWRKTYTKNKRRCVFLVRWNAYGMLEIRLPQYESKKRTKTLISLIWEKLAPAIDEDQFDEFDLVSARTRMLTDRAKNTHLYEVGTSLVSGPNGGKARLTPNSSDENPDSDPMLKSMLHDACKNKDAACDTLNVRWLTDASGGALTNVLYTIIGSHAINDLLIGAKTTSKAIDYVTDQLLQFAK